MVAETDEIGIEKPEFWKKILSALFYCASSFLITAVNKVVLTSYKFPSYQCLGIGQMLSTIVILFILKQLRLISFPDFTTSIPSKMFPLPLLYLGNLWFGLGGTQSVSLPMLTVIRRFTVLMTMVAQYYVVGTKVSWKEQLAVYIMIIGALIAAFADLAFDFWGYTFLLVNNVFTAANNVYIKKKVETKELGTYGVMFYNSLFMIVPVCILAWLTGDIDKMLAYDNAKNVGFVLSFSLSCVMGFLLTLSVFLCTSINSALTTTVMGSIKNIMVTYLGMFIGGDYIFTIQNFIGLNISISGSLFYSYQVFFSKHMKPSEDKRGDVESSQQTKAIETSLQSSELPKEDLIVVKIFNQQNVGSAS